MLKYNNFKTKLPYIFRSAKIVNFDDIIYIQKKAEFQFMKFSLKYLRTKMFLTFYPNLHKRCRYFRPTVATLLLEQPKMPNEPRYLIR